MPFIGNQLSTSFQNVETQTITGDGSTGYTLNNPVADGKDLLVYINNVKQEEGSGKAYTATGTTITFSDAVASTDSCYVVFIGQAVGTVTPKDGSIVSSMLANQNLEMPNTLDLNGKELILDADADTSITADTDDTIDIKIAGSDVYQITATKVDLNGKELVLDADGDTSITSDTDDQIDFKVGGTDRLSIGSTSTFVDDVSIAGSSPTFQMADTDVSNNVMNFSYDEQLTVAIDPNNARGNTALILTQDGNEVLRTDSSRNLLIGTTDNNPNNNSANSTADNGISIQPSGLISIATHQNAVMVLNRTGSNGQLVDIRRSGTSSGFIGTSETTINILGADGDAGLVFQNNSYGDIIYPASNASSGAKDDAIDLGYASGRFDDIYATNGTIQTSDQNEKQDIASATEKELNVAKKLSALFKTFKWKSKVAEKGDSARTHNGIVAQEVKSAFSAEGLDASNYALFTETSWWEEEDDSTIHYKTEQEYKDKGSPSSAVKKTRLGVRYPELFSFIFSSIEARLTALEAK